MISSIFISAFLALALGWVWYSPKMFGKVWLEAIGRSPGEVEESLARYIVTFVGWLVAAFVYGFLISNPFLKGIKDYILLSIAIWGAFMMPAKAHAIMWGNFNTKLLWIDGGYMLAGYLIFAFVFALRLHAGIF